VNVDEIMIFLNLPANFALDLEEMSSFCIDSNEYG